MYLKEKRDGRIKGRACTNGRPLLLHTTKAESTSPTASLAGMPLTCIIDAYKRRDVATCNITGAFLQCKITPGEKKIHVVLDGRMAELLAKQSPETYQKYVHHKREKALIYCELIIALYGSLKAALLFWIKLSKSLIKMRFKINPYDWFIANKIVEGSQNKLHSVRGRSSAQQHGANIVDQTFLGSTEISHATKCRPSRKSKRNALG